MAVSCAQVSPTHIFYRKCKNLVEIRNTCVCVKGSQSTSEKKKKKNHSFSLSLPLRYRLAGLPGEFQLKNITSAEINYCLIGELIIWTQYEIQVAAYTGAGLGVYSQSVTEYTLQGG